MNKNKYFFVRHGQNTHQAKYPDIVYFWPDGNPPYQLTEQGKEEAEKAGDLIKKKIDVVFSSDILRCRETAKIVAQAIGSDVSDIIYDTRLRDWNWGDFGGKSKNELWGFYNNDKIKAFDIPIPGGESLNQLQERLLNLLSEIEEEFENKNILIVSHGDPLWLLQGYMKGIDDKKELLEKRTELMLKTGEVREINA